MISNALQQLYLYALKDKYEIVGPVRSDNDNTFVVCLADPNMKPWDTEDFVFMYLTPRKNNGLHNI